MSEGRGVAREVQEQLVDYLTTTPKAGAVLTMSFFSGHLWVFIVTAYLRSNTRGNKLLESLPGRTAVGIFWFTAVLVPIYWSKFREVNFEYARILDVVIPTIVAGMMLQLVVFAFFAYFGDRK